MIPSDGYDTERRWLITKWPNQGKPTKSEIKSDLYMQEAQKHIRLDEVWLSLKPLID